MGVDFSGAGADNATWVTEGVLNGSTLSVKCSHPVSRAELTHRLAGDDYSVAGIDFPFGLPMEFCKELAGNPSDMSDVWKVISAMTYEEFLNRRDTYVKDKANGRLHLRAGDIYWPRALSCLQTGGPNMLPMTYWGMRMLRTLREAGCRVPPLDENDQNQRILLETMPGTALGCFGIQNTLYKNGSSAEIRQQRRQNRKGIFDRLLDDDITGITLAIPPALSEVYVENRGGDALDSLVAAVVAARWFRAPRSFRHPGDGEQPMDSASTNRLSRLSFDAGDLAQLKANEERLARLEGWIYAPRPANQ